MNHLTTLVFIRHGEARDTIGRCVGHTDAGLSAVGAKAITSFANQWRSSDRATTVATPTRIVSSDLARAFESACIIATAWGLPVERDARCREMNFGVWDGRPWSAIETKDGVRLRAWTDDWTNVATPGGEGLADVKRRAASWLDDTLGAASHDASVIVVVAHAGWIRAALSRLLDRAPADMFRLPVDYAHATVVSVGRSGVELIASNVAEMP